MKITPTLSITTSPTTLRLSVTPTLSISTSTTMWSSAYLPTPKLRFQEQISPKSGTQHSRTHQQMYPHINEINPATRFCGKITGQSTLCTSLTNSSQLRMLFADHARLSASPIISQHYCELQNQSSCECHLSRQWWQKTTSHGVYFLKCLETSPFWWGMVLQVRD